MTGNPNSKKVTIMRTESFMDVAQTLAKEFMSLSKKSIGSYWESVSSKSIGSGLDYNEKILLMPHVIDTEPTDRDFRQKVAEYFKDIITRIPFGTGLELEVGLLVSNDKPMGARLDSKGNIVEEGGKLNLPIDIADYIRYRHALGHPQVAPDRKSAIGDTLKLYYIHDAELADHATLLANEESDKAMITYMEIKNKPEKVSAMLLLLGVDPRDFSGVNGPAMQTERLRQIAVKDYDLFNKTYTTDNFELRVKVEGFLVTGIFNRVGDRVFETSTKKMIGKDMEDTIKILQDPSYSENMTIWSANYQDILAKPKGNRRRISAT